MTIALFAVLAVLALVVGYLFREYRRVSAALLLPRRGVPKEEVEDAVAARAIAAALADLREYTPGHIQRQADRLEKQRNVAAKQHKPRRPHGAYDPDQVREHVRIRVASAYARAGKTPPANLEQLIRREVPDEE